MIGLIDDTVAAFGGVILALALGLLAGIQRGWAQREAAEGTRFAGVRTFGLLGLAGGIAGHVFAGAETISAIILGTSGGLILLSYARASRNAQSISGTASIAGLIVMAGGFLAATGEEFAATAIVVVMVLLLTMRDSLHSIVARMTEIEVAALVRFALIALVILPLLPDRAFGPYDAWNPRQLWMVVVLVCGFSLAGYIAAKVLDPSRATIATAAAGSMVSSTAVTAALAARLKQEPANACILHGGIAAASAVMFVRVMVLTGVLAPFALPTLAIVATPGLIVSIAGTALFLWRARKTPRSAQEPVALRNPFDIGPALILMALVMVLSLIARWVMDHYGDAGLAVVLAISGTADVDSAIITMGGLPPGTLEPRVAGLVLLPPIVLNTLFKATTILGIAGWKKGWQGAAVLVASALASLAALPFLLD